MINKKSNNKTKYNVDKNTIKRTYKGIVFDSILEMRYYKEIILPNVESGNIKYYELQRKYILQPKFTKNGKTIKEISYIADFYIEYSNGNIKVIDIKGMPDNVSKIKRKMFWYIYPNIDYEWIGYSKIDGGWCNYDTINKNRKLRKLKSKQQ